MSMEVRNLASLLGVRSNKKSGAVTTLDLADAVGRGLAVEVADSITKLVAPDDVGMRNKIVPKATFMRRQKERRLSAEESGRVARLARVWAFALDVWGSPEAARHFLGTPHALLRNRIPRELALETDIGARAVEGVLGGLKYGTAV